MPDAITKTDQQLLSVSTSHSTPVRHIPARPLGVALAGLFSLSYVLCVLFDLWLPAYAMNPVWAKLLPGFVWLSWSSFFLGLSETIAYGWYAALVFAPLYNFVAAHGK